MTENATNITSGSNPTIYTAPTVSPGASSYDSTPRSYSRNLLSGSIRGNQNITGNISVINPANNQALVNIGSTATTSQNGYPNVSIGIGTNSNLEMLFSDGTNNRLLIGMDANNDPVVQTTPAGVEVTTAPVSQLSFDSNNSFTVLDSGQAVIESVTATANSTVAANTVVKPHNAGYYPGINCYGPLTYGGGDTSGLTNIFPPGIPLTAYIPISSYGQAVYITEQTYLYVYFAADTQNSYFGAYFNNTTSGSVTSPPLTLTYFVYTQNAGAGGTS